MKYVLQQGPRVLLVLRFLRVLDTTIDLFVMLQVPLVRCHRLQLHEETLDRQALVILLSGGGREAPQWRVPVVLEDEQRQVDDRWHQDGPAEETEASQVWLEGDFVHLRRESAEASDANGEVWNFSEEWFLLKGK